MLPLRRSVRETSSPSTPGMSTSSTIASGSPLGLEPLERLDAVLGELDLVALELERAPQRLAHGPLVVDDQDLHGRIVRLKLKTRENSPAQRPLLGVS